MQFAMDRGDVKDIQIWSFSLSAQNLNSSSSLYFESDVCRKMEKFQVVVKLTRLIITAARKR